MIEKSCIIDDDKIFIFGTKKILEITKFCRETEIFTSASDAVAYFSHLASEGIDFPEVVFLDLNLPVMDGWDFLEEFQKIEGKSPTTIFLVTSSIDPADLERAKHYDCVRDYVEKPLTLSKMEELKEKIAQK